MDPFSQMIGLLKPQAVFWRVVEAQNAWTIRFRPTNIVVFGQLIEGGCHVEREDNVSFDLEAGDFLLMAAPPNWSMAAFGGQTPNRMSAWPYSGSVGSGTWQCNTPRRQASRPWQFRTPPIKTR